MQSFQYNDPTFLPLEKLAKANLVPERMASRLLTAIQTVGEVAADEAQGGGRDDSAGCATAAAGAARRESPSKKLKFGGRLRPKSVLPGDIHAADCAIWESNDCGHGTRAGPGKAKSKGKAAGEKCSCKGRKKARKCRKKKSDTAADDADNNGVMLLHLAEGFWRDPNASQPSRQCAFRLERQDGDNSQLTHGLIVRQAHAISNGAPPPPLGGLWCLRRSVLHAHGVAVDELYLELEFKTLEGGTHARHTHSVSGKGKHGECTVSGSLCVHTGECDFVLDFA